MTGGTELWAGRYRRDRMLGRGAMGEVWLAHDVVLERFVAIKSIYASQIEPGDLERMAREARVAARIAHPNAVGIFDLVTVDGRPNLVMEYVDGTTLDELIAERGRLEPALVAAYGAAVADALAEAHRFGVVHRDIKPANILLTSRGVPKLADFGISRLAGDAQVTATGATIGTPAFLAPEIVHGEPADARSDLWSLGVTLYTALEGTSPFVAGRQDDPLVVLGRVLTADVPRTSIGGAIGETIGAMLDRDPDRRPSAEQVATALRDAGRADTADAAAAADVAAVPAADGTTRLPPRNDLPYAAAPVPKPAVPRGRPKSRRRLAFAVAFSALVLIGGTVTALQASSGSGGSRPPAAADGPNPTVTTSRSPGSATRSMPLAGAEGPQTYHGPGGIVLEGPAGWTRVEPPSGIVAADYLAPGTTDRNSGSYFRLGVFDPTPASAITQTAKEVRAHLLDESQSGLHDVSITSTTYLHFLGTHAVDIVWTGVDAEGVHRHGYERLWTSGGATREIVVDAGTGGRSDPKQVFEQLVSNVRVTG